LKAWLRRYFQTESTRSLDAGQLTQAIAHFKRLMALRQLAEQAKLTELLYRDLLAGRFGVKRLDQLDEARIDRLLTMLQTMARPHEGPPTAGLRHVKRGATGTPSAATRQPAPRSREPGEEG
jgi:hypothetical protein